MTVHFFQTELLLPRGLDEVFAFFGDAHNLQAITPPWLDFKILTPEPIAMKTGAVIDYRLKLHGVPFRWRTKITTWDPPHRFVDTQQSGPYRQWIHTHTFVPAANGTLCRDHVAYAVPGGALINRLFVRSRVERIFAYRHEAMTRLLG
jgi:ligand-binding SRPBCC domain-containing protein